LLPAAFDNFLIGGGEQDRTVDLLTASQDDTNHKSLINKDLQHAENPVTPTVTPENRNVPRKALFETLCTMPKEELLFLMAEVLEAQARRK